MPSLQVVAVQQNVQSLRTQSLAFDKTQIINFILMSLCAAMLLYYVLWANSLADGNYKLSSLREELAHATAVNSDLLARKSSMEDPAAAFQFAQAQHMVLAANASHVFESGNVALVR